MKDFMNYYCLLFMNLGQSEYLSPFSAGDLNL